MSKNSENDLLDKIRLDSGDIYALNELGLLYASQEKYDQAIEYYQKILKNNPCEKSKDPLIQANVLTNLVIAQLNLAGDGYNYHIEENLRKVINLDPNYTTAIYLLGRELVKLMQYEEAITILERHNEINDQNDDVWFLLGSAYSFEGEIEKCKMALEKVISLNPKHIPGWIGLGGYYEEKLERVKAIEAYNKVLEFSHPDSKENKAATLWIQGLQ